MEKLEVEDRDAKGKVSIVLQVLSGEKTVAQICRETGVKPLSYYKLEEKMLRGMLAAAKMPSLPRSRKDPMEQAASLAQETEEIRKEHRRMASLMRVSRKLLLLRNRKPRKNGSPRPKAAKPSKAPAIPARPNPPVTSPSTGA